MNPHDDMPPAGTLCGAEHQTSVDKHGRPLTCLRSTPHRGLRHATVSRNGRWAGKYRLLYWGNGTDRRTS